MSNEFQLIAVLRTDMGKGASRRLRREHKVPGIMYGGGQTPDSVTLLHKDVAKRLENEAFYSHILTINVAGKPQMAVLKALQRHPYKPIIMHLDFQLFTETDKIHMHGPRRGGGGGGAPGGERRGGSGDH